MPVQSAAMELKVLISILQSGTALQTMLTQVNQLSQAVAKLQTQSASGGGLGGGRGIGGPGGPGGGGAAGFARNWAGFPQQTKSVEDAVLSLEQAFGKLWNTFRLVTSGFLAFEGVRWVKSLADTAARAEVLETVLHVVAKNAGVTTTEIDKVSREVQRLGITSQSANESLTKFLQGGLDITKAAALARASQDLAVISGRDSSETFARLIVNIQQMDTLGTRMQGLIIDRAVAEDKYAVSIGKVASQLNKQEQQTAFLNAVIEKAASLDGAYEAAMGNVGKQLTSLARLTTDLATNMGNQLLPAYSALVLEYTNFLLKSNDIAVSFGTQTDAAEGLAEAVGALSHAFFELVLSIQRLYTEYSTFINFLIVSYAGYKGVTLLVSGLKWVFLLLFDTVVALSVRLIALPALLEAAAVAIGTFLTIGTGGGYAVLIGLGLLVAGLTTYLYNLIPASDEAADSLQTLASMDRRIAAARDEMKKASEALSKADKEGTKEQLELAQKEYDLAKARLKTEEDLKAARIATLEVKDPARLKQEEEDAKLQKGVIQYRNLALAASAAAKTLKVDVQGVRVLPRDFSEGLAGLKDLGAEYDDLILKIQQWNAAVQGQEGITAKTFQESIVRQIESVKERAKTVSTPEAFTDFEVELNKVRARIQANGRNLGLDVRRVTRELNDALETARIGQDKQELERTSVIDARRASYFAEQEKRTADALRHELALYQKKNEVQTREDKDAYDRGLLTLDQYHDRRLIAIRAQFALELAIAENTLASIEKKQRARIVRTPTEQAALETERRAAVARVVEARAAGGVTESNADAERRKERLTLERQISEQHLTNISTFGSEADALAKLNSEYAKRKEAVKGLPGGVETLEIEQAREAYKIHIEFREKALQDSLAEVRAQEDVLSLEQALLDTARSRVEIETRTGVLSEAEAMRARNDLLRRQIAIDRGVLQNKELELSKKSLELEVRIAEIELERATLSEGEYAERVRQLEDLKRQISALGVEVVTLNGAIEASSLEFQSYGKQLKEQFIDSFADSLTDSITNFKNAGKIWIDMATGISNQIIGIFAKAFSERLFKRLGIFDLADQAMNKLFGGGASAIPAGLRPYAEGGMVFGPGTGTSDSVPIMASAGEHIMPAAKAAQFMPLLEGIRTGKILPFRTGGVVQSIAMMPVIPRRYANGGVVVSDGGASAVQTSGGGPSNMMVTMHPDTLNMTMREWLEHEVVRQQGRR